MGTKIHSERHLSGFYSMRNINQDSSSSIWPSFFGDSTVMTNEHYCNGFLSRSPVVDGCAGHQKNALKQRMLEHEAVFKNQVSELHRLYHIQRNVMDEVKRTQPLHKHRASMEPASSSSIHQSKVVSTDAGQWHMAGFSLSNSGCDRTPVSEVKFVNSPVSRTNGSTWQLGQVPFQNGSTSKGSQALDSDSKPLKVRKKLFDLHLPAEAYIDTEEKKPEEYKVACISSYAANGSPNAGHKSSIKFSLDSHDGSKTDCRMDASASHLKESVRLADLNEPVRIEQETDASPFGFLDHGSRNDETKHVNEISATNAGYLGTTGDAKGRLSNIDEPGFSRSNLRSVTQGHQPVQSHSACHLAQGVLSQIYHPSGTCPTHCGRGYPWKEGSHHSFASDKDSQFLHNNRCLERVATRTHCSFPFTSSSSCVNSMEKCQPGQIWAKLGSTSSNSTLAMGEGLQPSSQGCGPFGGKWRLDASSKLNPAMGSEYKPDGSYHPANSGSKGLPINLPLASLYNPNCSRIDDLASDHRTNQQPGNGPNASCRGDSKPTIVINLNEALPKSSENEPVILQDHQTIGKSEPEDHVSALPWLKPLPTCGNQLFTPKGMLASSHYEAGGKKEVSGTQTVKKILGFPILDRGVPESEPSLVDCHPEGKNSTAERRKVFIDINVAFDPNDQMVAEEPTIKKDKQTGVCVRDYIDLNTCVSDCEDAAVSCNDRKRPRVETTLEIDLEVSVFPESEDDCTLSEENTPGEEESLESSENKEEKHDAVLRNAAERIVVISSSCPQACMNDSICLSLKESLAWFADAVSSCANELGNRACKASQFQEDSVKKKDDFEVMILKLEETKEEDYMPRPFVPDHMKGDDTGANTAPIRSRRGLSRRGRQRRDFQRDILPSLATLARHEVTEDVQTFGGLMKATGHPWNSGLARRNGGSRGRRRSVVATVPTPMPKPICPSVIQKLPGAEPALEERSLTGWGKTTTRRPRRQRCSAGNPPPTAVLI